VYSEKVSKPRLIVDGWNVSRRQYEDGKVTDLPDIRTIKPSSLAQGKPVTASSSVEGSTPAAVTDLDSTSRWVSSRSDNQWIAIDLGVPTTFSRVGLDWEAAYATDYQIQVSDDGATWRDVSHVTNGTGGNVILKFEPVVARHVRMLGNKRPGPYGFSLFDFAVYP
jgi:hexosaminidase